jgi:hypothetical protein
MRASCDRLQALVHDALVRRMHVDEHEAGAVLREDVDAVQLRQRETRADADRRRASAGRRLRRPRAEERA